MNRRIAAVALAAALVLLTGCTADGDIVPSPTVPADAAGDEGQSVQDACAILQDTITGAADDLKGADVSDPGALVDSMRSAANEIAAAAGDVTNDEVAALLPDLMAMFGEVGDVLQAIVKGDVGKIDDLAAVGESFQETSRAFQELCAAE